MQMRQWMMVLLGGALAPACDAPTAVGPAPTASDPGPSCAQGGPRCGTESHLPGGAFWPRDMRPRGVAQALGCAQESDCGDGLACVAGACQPCGAHGECQSDVCDRYAATPLGPGACLKAHEVVYASVGDPGCATGDGTRARPVCEIQDALAQVVGARFAIRIYPGGYRNFTVRDRTVFIYGPDTYEPDERSAYLGRNEPGPNGAELIGSRVVLDGLRSHHLGVGTAVSSQGSDVQVRRAELEANLHGIVSRDSDLVIDRVSAISTGLTGLRIEGGGRYEITNSAFVGGLNAAYAVQFTGPSSGRFLFNTIAAGSAHPGGIDCGATARRIEDSIVVDPARAEQTQGACIHQRVVVGPLDPRPDPGLIKLAPDLEGLRLADTPANAACCIDKGEPFVSSLYRDLYGGRRKQGESNDIGAHELR